MFFNMFLSNYDKFLSFIRIQPNFTNSRGRLRRLQAEGRQQKRGHRSISANLRKKCTK